jgi:hypothetical protein
MSVPWQTPSPIVKDAFLTELVIIDVRNWFFFHPLLQLIGALGGDTLECHNAERTKEAETERRDKSVMFRYLADLGDHCNPFYKEIKALGDPLRDMLSWTKQAIRLCYCNT